MEFLGETIDVMDKKIELKYNKNHFSNRNYTNFKRENHEKMEILNYLSFVLKEIE